jgi:hypothetical protein
MDAGLLSHFRQTEAYVQIYISTIKFMCEYIRYAGSDQNAVIKISWFLCLSDDTIWIEQ